MKKVSIIGAPTDIGAGMRGASMGPEALRVAHLQAMLESQGIDVADRGNLQGPGNPGLPPVDGYRHLPQVTAWNRAVFDACRAEFDADRLPIVVGGDHSLAIGSIAAAAQHARAHGRKLRVLWFDAHADANTNVLTPSGNIHGMPVAILLGHGPPELVEISGRTPAIQASEIRQIGIRSVDLGEKRFVHELGFEVFDMRYIDEMGMRDAMTAALAALGRDTHLHVSFDIDFLDPGIAPGVGTTVPGGPSYREAQL
ncbi:MAG: arginase, partial [Steroidobacteraceae bacterium]